jgi:uncharacterized protein with von Willebrand factor type A (vWA) domain
MDKKQHRKQRKLNKQMQDIRKAAEEQTERLRIKKKWCHTIEYPPNGGSILSFFKRSDDNE